MLKSLTFIAALLSVNPVVAQTVPNQDVSILVKDEWKCPKGNFPYTYQTPGLQLVTIFSVPQKHISTVFLFAVKQGVTFEVHQNLNQDNTKILSQCVVDYGYMLVNTDIIKSIHP